MMQKSELVRVDAPLVICLTRRDTTIRIFRCNRGLAFFNIKPTSRRPPITSKNANVVTDFHVEHTPVPNTVQGGMRSCDDAEVRIRPN